VGSSKGLDLCVSDPKFDVDLYVTTDARTLTLVWNGDLSLAKKIEDGSVDLHGPKHLQKAFQSWLQLGMFAGIKAAQ